MSTYGRFVRGDRGPLTHIMITTRNRTNLLKRSLESLFDTIDPVKNRLWIVDDNSDKENTDFLSNLNHPSIETILFNKVRVGQHAGINRLFSLIQDWNKFYNYPYMVYVVKVEDDILFKSDWLKTFIKVWENGAAKNNLWMLGGLNGEKGDPVNLCGVKVTITKHVSGVCMFSSYCMWKELLPVAWRDENDPPRDGCPSSLDWQITFNGSESLLAKGKMCGLISGLVSHLADSKDSSTWRNK
jgi:glycosyltransferase involved in cell wall biosynthesis